MMRLHVYGLVGLFAMAALAGCVGEEPGEGTESEDLDRVQFESETVGAVSGAVTTDELAPVAAAVVGIVDLGLQTTTDEAGRFLLNNVPEGRQQVAVAAFGYDAVAQLVEVRAQEVSEIHFTLTEGRPVGPYMVTDINALQLSALMWKLTPECIYTDVNTLVKTCGGVRFGSIGVAGINVTTNCGACEVHYGEGSGEDGFKNIITQETPDWKTIIAELDWEPQTGATGRGFSFDLSAPNITRGTGGSINQADPYTFTEDSDESPIVHRVDKPTTLEERGINEADWDGWPDGECEAPTPGQPNCDWFYRVFAAACDAGICDDGFGPDYGLMLEGRATAYMSFFFGDPAPAEYTLVPDR